ncbi:MAG: YtxH protein [Glaciihabitans sp.]|nr:YtxH protein [Glaciihabitans sp.]
MRGKILLVVGLGVGYVLGARAGRERYEEIKAKAQQFWNDPRVQKQVNQAEDFVKDKAPDVAEFLSDGARKVASQVSGAAKPAPRRSASSSAKSSTTKPSTAKK